MYKLLKSYWFVVGLYISIALRVIYLGSIPVGITLFESKLALSALNDNFYNSFLSSLVYVSMRFVGRNLFAVRLPFVLMSIGGIVGLYVLSKRFFSVGLARTITLIFAFTPWMIMSSRSADYWFFYFNLCLLILALIWTGKNAGKKWLKVGITLVVVGVYVGLSFTYVVEQSLFKNIGIMNSINEMRGQGTFLKPVGFWSRLFFNKSYFLIKILENEFELLKPQTYFSQLRLNHVFIDTETGLFLGIFIIPFLMGWVYILKKIKRYQALVGLFVIFGFSLPLILSKHLILSLLFPFAILVSSLVALGFSLIRKHKLILTTLLLIGIYNFMFVAYQYIYIYPKDQKEERCIYYKQIVSKLNNNLNKYDKIFISNKLCSNLFEIINFELAKNNSSFNMQKIKVTNMNNWIVDLKKDYLFLVDTSQEINFKSKYHVPTGLKIDISKTQTKEPCFKKIGEVKNFQGEIIAFTYERNNYFCLMK